MGKSRLVLGFCLALLMSGLHLTVGGEQIPGPTILDSTYLEWSYVENGPDGNLHREGTRTATVSYGTFNEEDIFILQGVISGTFSTSEGSGTESGQWKGYYRQSDMSLMYMWKEIDMYIQELDVSSTNVSELRYDLPYYRWLDFPLGSGSTWSEQVESTLSWSLYMDGEEFSGGSDIGTRSHTWACPDEQSIEVAAGTYDCHLVKEWEYDGDLNLNRNASYWYSADLGWWTKYKEWASYQGEMVLTKEWELTSTSGNNPPMVETVDEVVMEEDSTDSSIDLEDVFTDPEGDPLTYDAVDLGDLEVEIVGTSVSITPPENAFGRYRFNLTAKDPYNPAVKAPVRVVVEPVDDPTLITQGTVSPEEGELDTLFTFSVMIEDVEGDDPGMVSVVIDGSPHRMTMVSGSISVGAEFQWSGNLPVGEHEFHFETAHLRYPSMGELPGPTVTSTEEPTLGSPYLDLDEGGTETLFELGITWTDVRGREPEGVYLVVDEDEFFRMYSDDERPAEGMRYTVSVSLDEGEHMYHFEAELEDLLLRYPTNGELQGPDVFDPAVLDFGIRDKEPMEDSPVRFFISVIYGHGETPYDVKLVMDGEEYSMFSDIGDIRTGMNYTRSVDLEAGEHSYSFYVSIGGEELTTDEKSFTVEEAAVNDDDDVATEQGEGLDPVLIVIIVLCILVVLGVVGFILMDRRRKVALRKDEETWEEEVKEP